MPSELREMGGVCPHSAAYTSTHPQIALKLKIASGILQVPVKMAYSTPDLSPISITTSASFCIAPRQSMVRLRVQVECTLDNSQ